MYLKNAMVTTDIYYNQYHILYQHDINLSFKVSVCPYNIYIYIYIYIYIPVVVNQFYFVVFSADYLVVINSLAFNVLNKTSI